MIEDGLANEAITVRVESRRCQANHEVAGADALAADDAFALNDTNAEARHIVVARAVEVRQDGSLAADQRTFRFHAAVTDALDELLRQLRVILRHGDVIEEHERFAAGAEGIVDRHGDKVDADSVVFAGHAGDLEFAADAIGAGNEDRPAIVASKEPAVEVETE